MAWVNAGQGNMVWVEDAPSGGGSGPANSGTVWGSATLTNPPPPVTTVTANISPAVATLATQEGRAGVAGPMTATLTQMARMQADIDWLKSVIQKLMG